MFNTLLRFYSIYWLLLVVIMALCCGQSRADSLDNPPRQMPNSVDANLWRQLTQTERDYIQQRKFITVQNESDFAPFNFTEKGQPAGYSIDVIRMVGERLGLAIKFVQHKTWNQYIHMLQTKKLDAMVNIAPTPQRGRYALFTSPYAQISIVAVTRKDNTEVARTIASVASQRIAIINNYIGGLILKSQFPQSTFVVFENAEQALKAIANHKADIFYGNGIMANYYIEKSFISGLAFSPAIDELNLSEPFLTIATHKDSSVLHSILQKSVESISEHTKIQLRQKWGANNETATPVVNLTWQEQNYLKNLGTLRIASGVNYPPHTFIANGVEQGFTIDLIKLIGDILDLNLKFIPATWTQHLESVAQGQDTVDILLDVASTQQRRKMLIYTQPYYELRNVVAMAAGQSYIEISYDELKNRKIAAIKDWAMTQQIQNQYPDIDILLVESAYDALKAVTNGEVDAYVGPTGATNYLIKKHNIKGIQLIRWRERAWEKAGRHAFAMAHKHHMLRTIIDKTLLAIPDKKWTRLKNKWFSHSQAKTGPNTKLDRAQRRWLLTHDNPQIHLPNLGLPIGDTTNNGYEGIIADFINYFDQKLATQWLPQNQTAISNNTQRQSDADITIGHTYDQQLNKHFLFSQPIIEMPVVILTANPARVYVDSLAELQRTKTGVITASNYIEQLQKNYPLLELQHYSSTKAAILAVNSQDVEILLCPLLHCAYLMDELGTNKVRIVGQTDFKDTLRFAVRNDWPELVQIINNELLTMSPQLKNSIYRRWNTREDVLVKVDYTLFKYSLIFVILMTLIVIMWNRNISKYAAKTQRYAQSIEIAHEALKNTQSQLVHAEKMASLGTLTAGVAHEINNPTNFVRVGTQNLENDMVRSRQFLLDLAGENADEAVIKLIRQQFVPLFEHLYTIRGGAERITAIVKDLSAFSRMDCAEKTTVKLTDCIESTVNLVRTQYYEIAEISTHFRAHPTISCLPAQLNQVFLNIIVNACDAIKEKQRQTSSKTPGEIIVGCRIIATMVEVSIEDNGCGMSEETQAKLFEPFYTTKAVGEGTGLGMSISFGIIDKHGGTLLVDSTIGEGSKVYIRLPM